MKKNGKKSAVERGSGLNVALKEERDGRGGKRTKSGMRPGLFVNRGIEERWGSWRSFKGRSAWESAAISEKNWCDELESRGKGLRRGANEVFMRLPSHVPVLCGLYLLEILHKY